MSRQPSSMPADPRPYIAYRPPPTYQPTRSESAREAWDDVSRFLDRAAKPYPRQGQVVTVTARRWSAESATAQSARWQGEWPPECSVPDFDAAVLLANERFGKPRHRSTEADAELVGLEMELVWRLPIARIDEVLDFLERVPTCTGGEWAPVHASYVCLFRHRDPESGAVLPEQGERYHPILSSLYLTLQRRSSAWLTLTLPFAEPSAAAGDYVVALQEHAPVWLDPRYFDHMTPAPDGSRYHKVRLAPGWVGSTPDGALRLDPSRSGITPVEMELPTEAEMAAEDRRRDDAPFQANYAVVEAALRERTLSTLLIRGPMHSAKRYMVEQAALRLGLPVYVVRSVRVSRSPTLKNELRAIVAGSGGPPSLLIVEIVPYAKRETNTALLSGMAARVLLGVELPPTMRLVVLEETVLQRPPTVRAWTAHAEGFATREQFEFLLRQEARAAYREVSVVTLPPPAAR